MFRFAHTFAPAANVNELEAKAKAPNAPCQDVMISWIDCMKGAQVRRKSVVEFPDVTIPRVSTVYSPEAYYF